MYHRQLRHYLALSLLLLSLLAGCAPVAPATAPTVPAAEGATASTADAEGGFPVTIVNCDIEITYEQPPTRIVSMNDDSTLILLALGLEDKIVGIGYASSSTVPDEYQAAYDELTVLAEGAYPALEEIFAVEPDFIYASLRRAYGEEAAGDREALRDIDINSYLGTEYCSEDNEVNIDTIYGDIRNIGQIFGIPDRAEALVASMQAEIVAVQDKVSTVETPLRVFFYDSGEDTPVTAGGSGMAGALIELAGGENIFDDFDDEYGATSWELVVERDPEFIVIADYGSTAADAKRDFLLTYPPLSDVTAIREERFVTVPLRYVIAGLRNPTAVRMQAEAFYPDLFVEAAEDTEGNTAANSTAFPVTIDNCGLEITYDAVPTRAVTMNQAATEIMLALGLEGSMVGTAYMDDEIRPDLADAYASVPVLADEYPSQEVLFNAEPDFVYGVYRSAFGDEAAGPRAELNGLGIGSYLSEVACEDEALRPDKATFDVVFDEIRTIGAIFGVTDRAEALIADMQAQLDEVLATVTESSGDGEPVSIFWFDSGDDEPFVGACCGTPNMIIEAVGAENVFADASGNWATVSWEEVIARDPAAIVIIEADWSPAQDKIDLLLNNSAYASIAAVQNERFITIPFSATTLGVRNVDAVVALAEGLYPQQFE